MHVYSQFLQWEGNERPIIANLFMAKSMSYACALNTIKLEKERLLTLHLIKKDRVPIGNEIIFNS
jgi:hypothetical protein